VFSTISGVVDIVWLTIYLIYQLLFIVLPIYWTVQHQLPIASRVIVSSEQVRLIMKAHAFIRSNIPGIINHKKGKILTAGSIPITDRFACDIGHVTLLQLP
jgi:hypothetical protein